MKYINFKKIGFIFFITVSSLILFLLILEIALGFLPVRDGYSLQNIDDTSPVTRYIANESFTWSNQWNFKNVNKGRINNDGFVNDREYTNDDTRPLIAIIGDEQIEARMIPFEQTIQGILYKDLRQSYRVYSFGITDAPISQYLILAQHASQKYNAQKLVFFLTGNDFDNSFPQHYARYGHHQFFKQDDGLYKLERLLDYNRGFFSFFLRHSNLVRYIMFHVAKEDQLAWATQYMNMFGVRRTYPDFRYNSQLREHHDSQVFSQKALDRGLKAFDLFIEMLPQYTNVKKENMLFVLDTHWDFGAHKSYYALIHRYAKRQLNKLGYNHVDMTTIFQRRATNNSEDLKIDSSNDYNSKAHSAIAKEILNSNFSHK